MGSYYYLISSLPEVKLSDTKLKYDINSIIDSISSCLSSKDLTSFNYLLYQNDNKNLVGKIANSKGLFNPYPYHLEPSIFSKEEMEKYDTISNLPSYIYKFIENSKSVEWESVRQIENTLLNLYYEEMLHCDNSFIVNYSSFMRNLKNVLVALNCRALGYNSEEISKELVGDYSLISALTKSTALDFGVGKELPYINSIIELFNSSDKADPYNMENIEYSLVREFLDKQTSIKYFSIDNVFAYYINLTYVVSINGRDEEEGKKHLDALITSLKDEVF